MSKIAELVDELVSEIVVTTGSKESDKSMVKDSVVTLVVETLRAAGNQFSPDVEYSGTDASQFLYEMADSIAEELQE